MATTCASCAYENNDDARFCAGCGEPLGTTCTVCGMLVPPAGRFCPNCGTPLHDVPPAEAPVEERRVVSILFADLAGFTSRSDHADPEDVRRTLDAVPCDREGGDRTVRRRARQVHRRRGAWGCSAHRWPTRTTPSARSGPRSRSRRARRRWRSPVRARREHGRGGRDVRDRAAGRRERRRRRGQHRVPPAVRSRRMAGSRWRVHVPRDAWQRSTTESSEPVTVKGKADPLRVWLVEGMREEASGRADEDATPFVGRDRERTSCGAVRPGDPRTIAPAGDDHRRPGDRQDASGRRPSRPRARARRSTTWYRGRCLPYGESVTFAPLEEVVREATGVMRSDDREEAAAEARPPSPSLGSRAEDADWLRARLAPLLGLVDIGRSGRRQPRGVVRGMDPVPRRRGGARADRARDRGPALGRPGHARLPRSAGRSPPRGAAAAGDDGAAGVLRRPARLGGRKAELLDGHAVPARPRTICSGSSPSSWCGPCSRRRRRAHWSRAPEGTRSTPSSSCACSRIRGHRRRSSIALPETIHGLIAARLDALSPSQRSLLQDAAVVGDPFWSGALASMHDGEDVRRLAEPRRTRA